jgi:hypothetical protein
MQMFIHGSVLMRLFAALCIPAYIYFILVQTNDVDAWTWIVAYGLVLLACWGVITARFNAWWYRIVAIPYAIWGIAALMQTQGQWFDGEVEREAAGLGICVVTLVVLSFARRRHTL